MCAGKPDSRLLWKGPEPTRGRMEHRAVSPSEICDLLRQVHGIRSVDIRQGSERELEEINITVSPRAAEKRVVRDVESALLSGLGLHIDHRIIHIRRTPDEVDAGGSDEGIVVHHVGPGGAAASSAAKSLSAQLLHYPLSTDQRVRLENVRCDLDGRNRCEVTVELGIGGETFQRSVREVDTHRGRIQATGRATVNAIGHVMEEDVAIALEGIEEFSTWEVTGLLVLLRVRQGRSQKDFCGAALVGGDPLEATARAVLDASNRFLEPWDRERPTEERTGIRGRF